MAGAVAAAKPPPVPKLEFRFYVNESGTEPLRDWFMSSLNAEVRKTIGRDIYAVRDRWPLPLHEGLVHGLGNGLYEVRTTHNKLEYRVFFCICGSTMVGLHGFIKKSRAAPASELAGVNQDSCPKIFRTAPTQAAAFAPRV